MNPRTPIESGQASDLDSQEAETQIGESPSPHTPCYSAEEQAKREAIAAEALLELYHSVPRISPPSESVEVGAKALFQLATKSGDPQKPQELQNRGTRSSGRTRNASLKKKEADANAQAEEARRTPRAQKSAQKKRVAEEVNRDDTAAKEAQPPTKKIKISPPRRVKFRSFNELFTIPARGEETEDEDQSEDEDQTEYEEQTERQEQTGYQGQTESAETTAIVSDIEDKDLDPALCNPFPPLPEQVIKPYIPDEWERYPGDREFLFTPECPEEDDKKETKCLGGNRPSRR